MSYSVGVSNQIVPPQGSLLAYNKAGEMTVDNAGNVYMYDAEGRVTQANDGSYVTTYTYDGNGQRVGKQSTMASKLYWYGPDGKILNESDTSGNVTDRFGWFNGEMVARLDTSGNVLHYIYHDHLGSTRLVVTPTGQVQDDLDYYPFGTVIPKQTSSGNEYQFTGYETDPETSTEHAWFRNHNPSLGRYMRPDPYAGSYSLMDPQSLNRYSYVGNRVTTGNDPLGLHKCVGAASCGSGGGGSECANDPNCDGQLGGSSQGDEGWDPWFGYCCGVLGGNGMAICPGPCSGTDSDGNFVYFYATVNGGGDYYTMDGPGAMFYSIIGAGLGAESYINGTSIEENAEYAGEVYQDSNGLYSYTAPIEGDERSSTVDPEAIPNGDLFVADYHTHGADSNGAFDDENYSDVDLTNAFYFQQQYPNQYAGSFLGTPAGRVQFLVPFNPPILLAGPPMP